MNPERVWSRYDVEVQLGDRFFLMLFQAAFDVGIVPSAVPLGPVTFQLGRPKVVTLVSRGTGQLRIELPASVPGVPPRDVTIDLALGLSGADGCLSLTKTFVALDDTTLMMIPEIARPAFSRLWRKC